MNSIKSPEIEPGVSVNNINQSLNSAERFSQHGSFIYLASNYALMAAKAADLKAEQGMTLGPLHGLPIVVKDNIHVADIPNSAGTLA